MRSLSISAGEWPGQVHGRERGAGAAMLGITGIRAIVIFCLGLVAAGRRLNYTRLTFSRGPGCLLAGLKGIRQSLGTEQKQSQQQQIMLILAHKRQYRLKKTTTLRNNRHMVTGPTSHIYIFPAPAAALRRLGEIPARRPCCWYTATGITAEAGTGPRAHWPGTGTCSRPTSGVTATATGHRMEPTRCRLSSMTWPN